MVDPRKNNYVLPLRFLIYALLRALAPGNTNLFCFVLIYTPTRTRMVLNEWFWILSLHNRQIHRRWWETKEKRNQASAFASNLLFKTTRLEKKRQMRPNELRAILIFLITPTTTWLFAGYPYSTETQKAAQISKQKFIFRLGSLQTELMNASHSTNLFINSCDQISTNGKAPLHSHINLQHPTIPLSIRSDEGLTLETSAF